MSYQITMFIYTDERSNRRMKDPVALNPGHSPLCIPLNGNSPSCTGPISEPSRKLRPPAQCRPEEVEHIDQSHNAQRDKRQRRKRPRRTQVVKHHQTCESRQVSLSRLHPRNHNNRNVEQDLPMCTNAAARVKLGIKNAATADAATLG